MMNKTNHSISKRQSVRAAFLLAFAFLLAQPGKAQTQWVTNGNNINNTNTGNVGIGTATPASKLEVIGNIALSDSSRITARSDFGNYLMPYTAFGRMAFGTQGFDRMSILYNGNVGVGTTAPLGPLSVGDSAVANSDGYLVIGKHNGGGGTRHFRIGFDSAFNFVIGDYGNSNTAGPWLSPFAINWQAPSNSLYINSAGSIGIGTNTPATKLHVSGEILSAGPVAGHAFLDRTSGRGWAWYGAGDVARFWNGNFGDLIGITASGNVGIGTTTPASKLEVAGNIALTRDNYIVSAFDGSNRIIPYESFTGRMALRTGGVDRLSILYNGDVGVGTTAPSSKLHVVGDVTLTGSGNISASGTITAGNIVAKYQDIAEWVSARHTVPAGTVVVLDTDKSNQVVASQQSYDTRVAGVVSDSPGVILGEGGDGKVMVATTGRVKVKVDATRAPIRVGDILVTSDKEGIAMRSEPIDLGGAKIHRPGTIIGKALEPLDKGTGKILVLLSLQ